MSPLSFLSVPMSDYLSKSSKSTRRIWFLNILVSILASISSTLNGIWINHWQVMQLWLKFEPALYGWTIIMNNKKLPDCLWPAASASHFLPCSSWRLESFKVKMAWSDTSMVWPRKPKILLSPFYTWVLTGAPIPTKWAHNAPTFMTQSPPNIKMACTVDL